PRERAPPRLRLPSAGAAGARRPRAASRPGDGAAGAPELAALGDPGAPGRGIGSRRAHAPGPGAAASGPPSRSPAIARSPRRDAPFERGRRLELRRPPFPPPRLPSGLLLMPPADEAARARAVASVRRAVEAVAGDPKLRGASFSVDVDPE